MQPTPSVTPPVQTRRAADYGLGKPPRAPRVTPEARREAILQAAGTSLAHAVECLCLLSDIGDFAAFNEVYKTFFPTDPPARTTVQAVLPRPGLLVEIRTVAAMPPPRAAARTRKPARRAPVKSRPAKGRRR
jgi:hypothetical protein